jgi:hypothetical protein
VAQYPIEGNGVTQTIHPSVYNTIAPQTAIQLVSQRLDCLLASLLAMTRPSLS